MNGTVLTPEMEIIVTTGHHAGTNIVRDLSASTVEANEDDLLPTGKTLKDYLNEEDSEDDDFGSS